VLFTRGRELLVAARWKPLLQTHSVTIRSVSGTDAYLQIIAPEAVVLEADRPPLVRGDRCPGCGEAAVHRVEILEGDPPNTDQTGLWVSREQPLSIAPAAASLPSIAVSTRPIDERTEIHPRPVHRVGERVPAERAEEVLAVRGWNVSFISEGLLAALWDGGATGLEFRPVVQVR
jgi:hypothetical protein